MLLPVGSGAALAAGVVLSEQDKQCLACHSSAGLEKKLASGETLALHVHGGNISATAKALSMYPPDVATQADEARGTR